MRFSLHLAAFAILAGPALRADSLDDVLGRMDRAAAGFKSFSAKLKRTDFTAVLNESTEMTGTVAMRRNKKENEALTRFDPPDPHQIYFSGRVMERYYPKANTKEVYDAGKLGSTADQMMLLGFGVSSADLRKNYDIKLVGPEDVGPVHTTRIELTPKSSEVRQKYVTKIDLWIPNGEANPIQEKVTSPSKNYFLVTYSDMKLNPTLTEDAYTLKLPPGVKELHPQ